MKPNMRAWARLAIGPRAPGLSVHARADSAEAAGDYVIDGLRDLPKAARANLAKLS
jgi:hypothetical protein